MKTILIILLALVILVLLIWRQARTKIIRKQDKDILRLNLTLQDSNDLVTELIQKYGLKEKAKLSFKQKLDEVYRKQNLDKLNSN